MTFSITSSYPKNFSEQNLESTLCYSLAYNQAFPCAFIIPCYKPTARVRILYARSVQSRVGDDTRWFHRTQITSYERRNMLAMVGETKKKDLQDLAGPTSLTLDYFNK